jgi:hypothetical protein
MAQPPRAARPRRRDRRSHKFLVTVRSLDLRGDDPIGEAMARRHGPPFELEQFDAVSRTGLFGEIFEISRVEQARIVGILEQFKHGVGHLLLGYV